MNSDISNENARRAFWTQSMDDAYDFVMKASKLSIADCGEKMISLSNAADDAGVEVTFSNRPHVENLPRIFYLREGLINDFVRVAQVMNKMGWILHIEDAYRTRQMQGGLAICQANFDAIVQRAIWESGDKKPDVDLIRRRLASVIAASPNIGAHMGGAAMDISVFRRSDHSELDRGAPYLTLSELTPMDNPFISPEAKSHRREITDIFLQEGNFVTYPWEFWHYSRGDVFGECLIGSSGSAYYGPVDFDPETGQVTPIENPTQPLVDPEDIERRLSDTLKS